MTLPHWIGLITPLITLNQREVKKKSTPRKNTCIPLNTRIKWFILWYSTKYKKIKYRDRNFNPVTNIGTQKMFLPSGTLLHPKPVTHIDPFIYLYLSQEPNFSPYIPHIGAYFGLYCLYFSPKTKVLSCDIIFYPCRELKVMIPHQN